MVESNTKQNSAVILSIISLIAALGLPVSQNIFDDELANYYVCPLNNDLQEFKGGISSTGLTGYPYAESRKGYVRCQEGDIKGSWTKLSDYAKEMNIDPYDLIEEKTNTKKNYDYTDGRLRIVCTQSGCVDK